MSEQRLPPRVELRLQELAEQIQQRAFVLGLTRFCATLAALTAGLWAAVSLMEGTPIPTAVPLAGYAIALVWAWNRWLLRGGPSVTREQLALFLDEHYPELENLFVTGASLGRRSDREAVPEWLLERFFEKTQAATEGLRLPHAVTGATYRRLAITCVLSGFLGLSVFGAFLLDVEVDRLGDGFFTGMAPAAIPFRVEPGDVRVTAGEDRTVWVHTSGEATSLALRWREEGGTWVTEPLQPSRSDGVFYHPFRALTASVDYQVQVEGGRSDVYRISVWTPPEVVRVDVRCVYPDYLNLEPRTFAFERELAVPEGSRLTVEVSVNKPMSGVYLFRGDDPESGGDTAPQVLDEDAGLLWSASFTAAGTDSIRFGMTDREGNGARRPRTYVLTTVPDAVPEVRLRRPRGDGEASAIEEVPLAFDVRDDHRLKDYGLAYTIAGREPVRLSFRNPAKPAGARASVDTVLMLETLDLAPGDFLTWSVWAEDEKPGRDPYEVMGDPYLLEIRPFARRYTRSVSNPSGSAGGSGGGAAQRQKQVMVATWNLRRKGRTMDPETFAEHRGQIVRSQQEVASSAEGDPRDPEMRGRIEALRRAAAAAVKALEEAVPPDASASLSEALREEQRVYGILLSLEPEMRQVARGRQGQGGGAGGSPPADVEALELAARRDFREQASTLNDRIAETERVRNELEDLARRQQMINEEVADLVSERAEAETTPEAERRLKQLLEEQRRSMAELDRLQGELSAGRMEAGSSEDARRRLQDARQQMARGAGHLESNDLQRARSSGNRALDALGRVQQQLQQLSRQAAADRMHDLLDRMREVRASQEQLADRVDRQRGQRREARTLEGDGDASSAIAQEKETMAERFRDLMETAGDLSERSEASQELMAQRLGDWVRETARQGIYEDMQGGDSLVRYGAWEEAHARESEIGRRLADAEEGLAAAAEALVPDDATALRRATETLEDLLSEAEAATPAAERTDGESPAGASTGGSERGRGDGDGDEGGGDEGGGDGAGAGATAGRGDFQRWDEALRTAEALLPDGTAARRGVGRIREGLRGLDRRARRDGVAPDQAEVTAVVFGPLVETVDRLRAELDRTLEEQRIVSPDGPGVPERYRKAVADYFRLLSESGAREP